MKRLSTKHLRLASQLAGAALFIVILQRIDVHIVMAALGRMSAPRLAVIAGVLLCFTLLKGLRWRAIAGMQGFDVTVPRSFAVYAASLYLGFLTPGRIGDFAKSIYLRRGGMTAGRALFSSLVDRLCDLFFLVAACYASLLAFPGIFSNQLALGTVAVCIVATAGVGFFWKRRLLKRFTGAFAASVMPHAVRSAVNAAIDDIIDEFDVLRPAGIAVIALLTICAWTVHYLVFIIFAGAVGVDAPVHFLIMSVSFAIFTALLPVSISGLGTRELVLIFVFSRAGLPPESAVSFSLTFIVVYLIQGVVGLVCWMLAPFSADVSALRNPGP